jgi:SAM-dependent methyltransferase
VATEQTDQWLQKVFEATDRTAQIANYDGWADSYDADIVRVGYLTPSVLTGLISRHVPQDAGAVLDAGAGTGMVGAILSVLGYRTLVGVDMSDGMLARARARGIYAELRNRVLGEPLDFPDGHFAACAISGVFNAGHAPASSLDELVRVVRPGGVLAFNIGEQAWIADGFKAKLEELVAAGRWRLLTHTEPYRTMPLSAADGHFTAQAFAFAVA